MLTIELNMVPQASHQDFDENKVHETALLLRLVQPWV